MSIPEEHIQRILSRFHKFLKLVAVKPGWETLAHIFLLYLSTDTHHWHWQVLAFIYNCYLNYSICVLNSTYLLWNRLDHAFTFDTSDGFEFFQCFALIHSIDAPKSSPFMWKCQWLTFMLSACLQLHFTGSSTPWASCKSGYHCGIPRTRSIISEGAVFFFEMVSYLSFTVKFAVLVLLLNLV